MRYLKRSTSVVYRYSARTPDVIELPSGYETTQLDPATIKYFFDLSDDDRWRAHAYLRLFDRGCYGHLIHVGSEWAAVQWLATPESAPPPHLPARLTRGNYWCLNEHTRERYRRRGLWGSLKRNGIRYARDTSGEPNCPVFSDTDVSNTGSRNAHEKIGFVPEGTMTRTKIIIPKLKTFNLGTWNQDATHPHTQP